MPRPLAPSLPWRRQLAPLRSMAESLQRPRLRLLALATGKLLAFLAAIITLLRFPIPHSERMWDFGSFYAAGLAARTGQNPYGLYELSLSDAPNLNPPISLLLFEPLSLLPPATAHSLWYGTSLVIFASVLVLLWRTARYPVTPTRLVWALTLTAFVHTVALGQVYILLLLAVAGAWTALRQARPLAAGLLIGLLVAVKPNFIVWPLLLLLAGAWPVGLAALGMAVGLSAVPLLRYGPSVYAEWLSAARLLAPSPDMANVWSFGSGSLPSLTQALGLPWLGLIVSVLLLGGVAVWVWRTRPPVLTLSGVALVAGLLASPIAWDGYLLLLLPLLFDRLWTRPLLLATALMMWPVATLWTAVAAAPAALTLSVLLLTLAALLVPDGPQPTGEVVLGRTACSG